MGFLMFLGLNVLLVRGIVTFVRKPGTLTAAAKEWVKHPFINLFLLAWMSCILVTGWGVLSDWSWKVHTPWGRIDSWKLAGLLSFVGVIIIFVASARENHFYRKKYYEDRKS